MPGPHRKFRDTLHSPDWVRAKHAAGWTATAIASAAGCSVVTACRYLDSHVGPDWNKSPRSDAELEIARARFAAQKLYPDKQPCLVCGDPAGQINHIDMDPRNNASNNVEWLCRTHHLMVDKRRAAEAALRFRLRFHAEFLEIHAETLAQVRADPKPRHERIPPQARLKLPTKLLTQEQADEILRLKAAGQSNGALASAFGASKSTVSRVCRGTTLRAGRPEANPDYAGPTPEQVAAIPLKPRPRREGPGNARGERQGLAVLTEPQVLAMRAAVAAGASAAAAWRAHAPEVSRQAAFHAVTGKTWCHVPGATRPEA